MIDPAKTERRGDVRLLYFLSDRGPASTGGHWVVTVGAPNTGGGGGDGWREPDGSDTGCAPVVGGTSPPTAYQVSGPHEIGDLPGIHPYYYSTGIPRSATRVAFASYNVSGKFESYSGYGFVPAPGGTLTEDGPGSEPGMSVYSWSIPNYTMGAEFRNCCHYYTSSVVGEGSEVGYRTLNAQVVLQGSSSVRTASAFISPAWSNYFMWVTNFIGIGYDPMGPQGFFPIKGIFGKFSVNRIWAVWNGNEYGSYDDPGPQGGGLPGGYSKGGRYSYTCTCPDFTRKREPLATPVFRTELITQNWEDSNAGLRDAPCKHILSAARNVDDWATLFFAMNAGANDLPAREYWYDPVKEWEARQKRRADYERNFRAAARGRMRATERDRSREANRDARAAWRNFVGTQRQTETERNQVPYFGYQPPKTRDQMWQEFKEDLRLSEPVQGIRPITPKGRIIAPRQPRKPRQ